MSDQFRTETRMTRPPLEKPSSSIFVKGHGPAIQDTLRIAELVPLPGVEGGGANRRLPFAVRRAGRAAIAGHVARVHYFESLDAAAYICRIGRAGVIPQEDVGNDHFWAVRSRTGLFGHRRHAGNAEAVIYPLVQLERLDNPNAGVLVLRIRRA